MRNEYDFSKGKRGAVIPPDPNPDKPETTNCKYQISISKSQIRSKTNS
jgi:hypothetical protein